jgi:hypothetical protein
MLEIEQHTWIKILPSFNIKISATIQDNGLNIENSVNAWSVTVQHFGNPFPSQQIRSHLN